MDIISRIRKLANKDDGLLKAGFIFLIGSFSVSLFNYLYQIFMGRMLGPEEYGVLGSLFAIVYFVQFGLGTFNKVISKYSSEFSGQKKFGALKYLIRRSILKIILYGAVGLVLFVFLSPFIADYMKLESSFEVILVGVLSYISIIYSVIDGALNGLQKFVWQNISGSLNVFFKFFVAVLLVYLGFGVTGALVALIIAALVGVIISSFPLYNTLKRIKEEKFISSKVYRYAVPVALSSVIPILMITLDQVLVKHYFSSEIAGHYAAAGNIAKIIWFGSGFFVMAIFPKITNLIAQKKDASRLLVKSIAYTSTLATMGIIAYFVMPTFIVNLLYGSEYLDIVSYIGFFGLAMGLFSVGQIFITYNLAAEKYGFIWIVALALLVEILGIILYNQSVIDIVKIIFGANLMMVFMMFVYNHKDLGVSFEI